MKTPCEIIVWQILPVIRKELAKNLVGNHGLTQREAAKILGTTEASVSRYISGKRGHSEINDNEILNEIGESANRIFDGNGTSVIKETCKICNLIKSINSIDDSDYCGR